MTAKSTSSSSRREKEKRAKVFSGIKAKLSQKLSEEEIASLEKGEKGIPDYAAKSTVLDYLATSQSVPTRPPVNPVTIDLSAPKEILSHAQRRKLKQPAMVITKEQKEAFREAKREERKMKRLLKSSGARRKLTKLRQKRARDEGGEVHRAMEALDPDYQPWSRGRRLE